MVKGMLANFGYFGDDNALCEEIVIAICKAYQFLLSVQGTLTVFIFVMLWRRLTVNCLGCCHSTYSYFVVWEVMSEELCLGYVVCGFGTCVDQ